MPYRAIDIEYQLFMQAEMQDFPTANHTALGKRRRIGSTVDLDDDYHINCPSQRPATKRRKVSSWDENRLVIKHGLGMAEPASGEQYPPRHHEKPRTSTKATRQLTLSTEDKVTGNDDGEETCREMVNSKDTKIKTELGTKNLTNVYVQGEEKHHGQEPQTPAAITNTTDTLGNILETKTDSNGESQDREPEVPNFGRSTEPAIEDKEGVRIEADINKVNS
ncbi:hypothetical protein F4803DRAFT_556162 [Xylaria telfairii]|nr:hypothetical protein F4803DRAFT_556162 [Xylaria telfairii]